MLESRTNDVETRRRPEKNGADDIKECFSEKDYSLRGVQRTGNVGET